jgi:heme-degrading monooxygenase HmoA
MCSTISALSRKLASPFVSGDDRDGGDRNRFVVLVIAGFSAVSRSYRTPRVERGGAYRSQSRARQLDLRSPVMYVVTNRVPVAEDYVEMFEQRFRERAGQIDKQPGFVHMAVLRPDSPDTPFLVQTTWVDKQAFEAWVGSEDFKLAHRNPMPKDAFVGEGRIERFEVIIQAEASA